MSELTLHCVGDVYASQRALDAWRSDPTVVDAARSVLAGADLGLANLEAPLVDGGQARFSTGVRLHSPPAVTGQLRDLGVGVVTLANNHMMDYGPAGLTATLERLRSEGVGAAGAGPTSAAAREPVVRVVKGQRVGILAACDNEGGGATPRRPGVALVDPRALAAAVRRLRGETDYVVAAVHTGIEFSSYPEPYFVRLARRLVDAGAAVVLGHHPHVPQAVERYGPGLIAYSLGDFLFDLPRDPEDFTPRQRFWNACHPVLEVRLAGGRVAGHRVSWLGRDAGGRYFAPAEDALGQIEREFDALCRVLADRPEYRRRVGAVYRMHLKGTLYHTPLLFFRDFRRGGSRHLKRFLWWLGTLRRRPKRRLVLGGLNGLVQAGVDRLRGELVEGRP
jgi:poly-gamma-glutamate synthesis protein (capsule biosynthesis protein)